MSFVLGVILLLLGAALVLLAWPGGSALGTLSMSGKMMVAYGGLCLTLVGLGIIAIVQG